MRLRSLWLGAGPDKLGVGHDWWRAGLKGGPRGGDRQQRLRAARLLRCRERDWQRRKKIPGERDVLHQREDKAVRGLRGVGLWVGMPWMPVDQMVHQVRPRRNNQDPEAEQHAKGDQTVTNGYTLAYSPAHWGSRMHPGSQPRYSCDGHDIMRPSSRSPHCCPSGPITSPAPPLTSALPFRSSTQRSGSLPV